MRLLRTLLCATLCALLVPCARAGTSNLRWNACWGDGGIQNRVFACDTNTGSELLVVSFIPTEAVSAVNSVVIAVGMVFPGTSVPPWWQLRGSGSCRTGSLSLRPSPPLNAAACQDWADGNASGLVTAYASSSGSSIVSLVAVSQLASGGTVDLTAGQEYFAGSFTITHAKTLGSGSCAGCDLGGCLGVKQVQLTRDAPQPPYVLGNSRIDDAQCVWQGAAGVGLPNYGGAGFLYCPGVTAARQSTWGSVKSLYR